MGKEYFNQLCQKEQYVKTYQPLPLPQGKPIHLLGMGFSGIAADLIKQHSNKQITVHKNYDFPNEIQDQIVIAISHSGNTEETIAALEQAKKQGNACYAITSGGQIAKKYPHSKQTPNQMPRTLTLEAILIGLQSIHPELVHQENIKKHLKNTQPLPINPEKHTLILYTKEAEGLANYTMGSLAENGKHLCSTWELPDFHHHQYSAWTQNQENCQVILCTGKQTNKQMQKRIQIVKDTMHPYHLETTTLPETIQHMQTIDLTAYQIAETTNADPEDTSHIEKLKKALI